MTGSTKRLAIIGLSTAITILASDWLQITSTSWTFYLGNWFHITFWKGAPISIIWCIAYITGIINGEIDG